MLDAIADGNSVGFAEDDIHRQGHRCGQGHRHAEAHSLGLGLGITKGDNRQTHGIARRNRRRLGRTHPNRNL